MCVIYLLSRGSRARKSGGRAIVERAGARLASVPIGEVESVVLTRSGELTTPLLYELMERGKGIFYVDGRGRVLGELSHGEVTLARFQRQWEAFSDERARTQLIRLTIGAKLDAQREILKKYAKTKKDLELAHLADELRSFRRDLMDFSEVEELRGLEGMAARVYFSAFPFILDQSLWPWEGRSRRPPRDAPNALLSFGYAFLEREVRLAILGAGLDARLGFFHANNGRKDSLVFDLMEPFRPSVIDRFVLRLLNRGEVRPADFTESEEEGVRLTDAARSLFIERYEAFMERAGADFGGLNPRAYIRQWVRELARGLKGEESAS